MKAGDILLFHRNTGFSKLISWGCRSIYSHCAVCVNADMNLAIEAQGRVRGEDIRRMTEYDVFRVKEVYPYELDDVVSFLVGKLNSRYDYLGVIFLGFLKLIQFKRSANKWQKKNDYFCSELVSTAFRVGGLDLVKHIGDSVTSPADIARSEVVRRVDDE